MTYRQLTKEETEILLSQNCFAENWENIRVTDAFSARNIMNTRFEGIVRLGNLTRSLAIDEVTSVNCGIYNSCLCNCDVGDNVYITDVKRMSNYKIEAGVLISNVGSMVVDRETTFGNGTEIEVLNEGGGRELPIFDRLSSQIAYLAVIFRHDSAFINKLLALIRSYCETKRSDKGLVEEGTRIKDTTAIRNVNIGSFATISGSGLLEEGTIKSRREAPSSIGTGVIARHFIVLSGSSLDEDAIIDKSFVGQGVKIGKQFSAENCLFFANSEAFHGEAVSLFAGPYTVTHHKSTLLIACMTSFFNAGSGSNQSNHMYKLGPLHQGILDRGSKTGSFSYLLLPGHIGPFSVAVGKHYTNFDASDFPFSYISEEKGKSELIPAMNLFTVGTRRDIDKWPSRDRRTDPDKLDLITFELFNPYIIGKVLDAISLLNDFGQKTDKKTEYVNFKGLKLHRLVLKTTRKYYEMAVKVFIGQEVVKRLDGLDSNNSFTEIKSLLSATESEGAGKWMDISGLFVPVTKIVELMTAVKSSELRSVEEITAYLKRIFDMYYKYMWVWCSDIILSMTGKKPENLDKNELINIITDWKTNAAKLNNMIVKDAEKEFDQGSRIGYGLDADEKIKNADFVAVRGNYENNKFVIALNKESQEIILKADNLISLIENMK
jgi:hypothetical protein